MGVVNWVGSNGSLQFNGISLGTSSSNAGIGDVIAVPLTAGMTNNLAIRAMLFAPTGQFRPGNLSNLGMGEWTITPKRCTYLLLEEARPGI
jgi:hypothetical protein